MRGLLPNGTPKPDFHKTNLRQIANDKRGAGRGGARGGMRGGCGGNRGGNHGRGRDDDAGAKSEKKDGNLAIEDVVCVVCGENGHWPGTCNKTHPKLKAALALRDKKKASTSATSSRKLVDDLRS